ncbi:MAG TPA: SRPBCC family protein, partial [Intrasporangiaceae bacterium]|nr:SRPBCC family protein [Intrasporangiaceae bacterium]
MELTHNFVVPADMESTWATFLDLERVGGCFPGATVTEASGDSFAGTVKVKLGPIALQYLGSGAFLEKDEVAKRAVIEAKGKDKRGNGTAGATVIMQLAPSGEGTRVDVTTELAITGKPAQFGRGVMQDVSDKLLQQFIACIEGQFADVAPAPEMDAAPTETVPTETVPAEPSPVAPGPADAAPAEPT